MPAKPRIQSTGSREMSSVRRRNRMKATTHASLSRKSRLMSVRVSMKFPIMRAANQEKTAASTTFSNEVRVQQAAGRSKRATHQAGLPRGWPGSGRGRTGMMGAKWLREGLWIAPHSPFPAPAERAIVGRMNDPIDRRGLRPEFWKRFPLEELPAHEWEALATAAPSAA